MNYFIPVHNPKGEKVRIIMAKRGRKAKIGIARQPNGQPSRSKSPAANEEPIALRARVFGLTEKEARDQMAGSFIGRMHMMYVRNEKHEFGLSEEQYDAGVRYLELRNQFHKQIGAGTAIYERVEGLVRTMTDSERTEQWSRIKARWTDITQCIQEAQNQSRGNLWAALDYCVVRDGEHKSMIGDLRIALNALDLFFHGARARKAA